MASLHWLDSFATGNIEIDRQHRRIVAVLNETEADLGAGDFAAANRCCHSLRDLLQDHFAHEERLLAEAEFPRLRSHIGTHAAARGGVEALLAECAEKCELGAKVGCIGRWCTLIVSHLLMADLDFKSHLLARDPDSRA